jgi:DNA adenine methylase
MIRRWLASLPEKPALLVEPFAGGGIISLTVACENLADKVIMVELDERVASVWKVILGEDVDWLIQRILNFELSNKSVESELAREVHSLKDLAFQTLLMNRTRHGGIMAPGSGSIRSGESGKGIGSRWYPQTICNRIRKIAKVRDKIRFVHGDGMAVIKEHATAEKAAFFIDPPYTASKKQAGRRLYTHNEINHEDLFGLAVNLRGDCLITYDNANEIREIAYRFGLDCEPIAMKSTHHAQMSELLIGRDLWWSRM